MKTSVFALLTALLTACSSASILSERDNGKTFFVRIGDRQVVSLPENPTTGYSWQFFITPENQNAVSDVTETYIAPESNLSGAGGIKEYAFTFRQKGTITVTGYYFRPWEKRDEKKDRKVSYTFNISD